MNKEDLLKTPRGRAIIKLGIYLVFFIIVAFLFHAGSSDTSTPNKEVPKKDAMEVYSDMTNYEYTYQYNDLLMSGKVYRDKIYFEMNEDAYYVNENVYKVDKETNEIEPVELDKLYYINNHIISDYIKKGNIIGKNEDFENNIVSITYGVSNIEGLADKLSITTYEKDNIIFKVLLKIENNIDLEDYSVSTIEINYSNMDKVINFIKDFKVKE